MPKFIIYMFESPSGKKYIGQTVDLERRISEHRRPNSKCTAFSNAIKKYGFDNFRLTVLSECETIDEANYLESYYIEGYKSFESGYNLTKGGDGIPGKKHTDVAKSKISAANKGKVLSSEHLEKLRVKAIGNKHALGLRHSDSVKKIISTANLGNDHFLGKSHSDEIRIKISTANKGNKNLLGYKHSNESKEKISKSKVGVKRSDSYGEKLSLRNMKKVNVSGVVYESMADVATHFKIHRRTVRLRILSPKFTDWRYE